MTTKYAMRGTSGKPSKVFGTMKKPSRIYWDEDTRLLMRRSVRSMLSVPGNVYLDCPFELFAADAKHKVVEDFNLDRRLLDTKFVGPMVSPGSWMRTIIDSERKMAARDAHMAHDTPPVATVAAIATLPLSAPPAVKTPTTAALPLPEPPASKAERTDRSFDEYPDNVVSVEEEICVDELGVAVRIADAFVFTMGMNLFINKILPAMLDHPKVESRMLAFMVQYNYAKKAKALGAESPQEGQAPISGADRDLLK